MRHRIARIGVLQTAIFFGVLYAVLGLCILPFFYAMMRFAPMASENPFPFGGGVLLFMPIVYGVMGFIITAIGAVIYNVVAGWTGGIEIELNAVGSGEPA
jgi:hypothetical protein